MSGGSELTGPCSAGRMVHVAGWVPFWRGGLEGARKMFEEALQISRDNPDPDGDAWGEARALVALTSVISPIGNEEEALQLGRRALELGRGMGEPVHVAGPLVDQGETVPEVERH